MNTVGLAVELFKYELMGQEERIEHPLSEAAKSYLTERTALIRTMSGSGRNNVPEPWTYRNPDYDTYRHMCVRGWLHAKA